MTAPPETKLADLIDTGTRHTADAADLRLRLAMLLDTSLGVYCESHPEGAGFAGLRRGKQGLYDWTYWLVAADWFAENGGGKLVEPAIRRLVVAMQTVRDPHWWLDFAPMCDRSGRPLAWDAGDLTRLLKTLVNKPFPAGV